MRRVGILHSTSVVVEPVKQALKQVGGDYEFYHYVDEGLLRMLMERGSIDSDAIAVMRTIVTNAQLCGIDGMVVSCSSLSPIIDEFDGIAIPVAKIDEAMITHAVGNYSRIGLVMSNPTTMKPSLALIAQLSEAIGKEPSITPVLVEDAFKKKASGDVAGHDSAMIAAVGRIADSVDIILLAQISLDGIKPGLPEAIREKTRSSLDFLPETLASLGL